jgi:hypothetical protein
MTDNNGAIDHETIKQVINLCHNIHYNNTQHNDTQQPSIKGLFVTISITTLFNYAVCQCSECYILLIVVLNATLG